MKSIFILIVLVVIVKSALSDVADSFKSARVVDDLINQAPDSLLNVEFHCNAATLGNKLSLRLVQTPAKVSWKNARQSDLYTLVMTDVLGKSKEFVHWIVGNIPGNNLAMGNTYAAFLPPTPPKDSGDHRYVYLLYKQSARINVQPLKIEDRFVFSTRSFSESYKLGPPVAGNFYLAAYEA